MKSEMVRWIASGLRKFDLTEAETEWVHFAESNLDLDNPLSGMMELTLERIYREKTALIHDSVMSLLKQDTPVAQPGQVPNHGNEIAGSRL